MFLSPKPAAPLTPPEVKQDIARRQLLLAQDIAKPGESGSDVLRESYRRATLRLGQQ
jgi:hypothetical protein